LNIIHTLVHKVSAACVYLIISELVPILNEVVEGICSELSRSLACQGRWITYTPWSKQCVVSSEPVLSLTKDVIEVIVTVSRSFVHVSRSYVVVSGRSGRRSVFADKTTQDSLSQPAVWCNSHSW